MAHPKAEAPLPPVALRRRLNIRSSVALALGFVAIFTLALVVLHQWLYSDRIALGVTIHDIDVGALSQEEAQLRLTRTLSSYVDGEIILQAESRSWQLAPRELGLSFDVKAMIAEAYSVGKEGNILERLLAQLGAVWGGREVALRFTVDEESQRRMIQFVASSIDSPAVDAGLVLQGQEILATSSQWGYGLDRKATAALLTQRYSVLSSEPIALPMTDLAPALTEADVTPVKTQAETMIGAPLTMRYEDRTWTGSDGNSPEVEERTWQLDPITLTYMLRFSVQEVTESKQLVAHFDEGMVRGYGKELAKDIDRKPRDARLTWKEGRLSHLVPSQEGLELDLEALPSLINNAAQSGDRTVDLPVIVTEPKISLADMPSMGIVEKIGEWSTVYGDSYRERRINVELAASRINGVVVPPGEVFSFNEAVGEVSAETGYAVGLSIVGDQTVPDAGGGVCQVSTTVFQAAFWAGYPIIERYPHSYRLSRYEPPAGLDATVYAPSTDFKFKNDTDTHLLIQAHTDGQRIYVALYGSKPPWEVEVEGPFLSNWVPADTTVIKEYSTAIAQGRQIWVEVAGAGVDVTITRIVTQDGKETGRRSFFSRYRPQRNVLLIGGAPPQGAESE